MNARAHIAGLTEALKHIRPRRMPKLVTTQCAHCYVTVRFSKRVGKKWARDHRKFCKKIN
jgi:hypothetical protein